MDKEQDPITKQMHGFILVGLSIAFLVLTLFPLFFYIRYENQFQISLIISISFIVSIISFLLDLKFPKKLEKIATIEFIFYSVTIGLVIHYISYLNGPLIFIYGLVVLSASYFLSTTNLNYIGGITALFVVSEYFILLRNEDLNFSPVDFAYVLLRVLYLVLLAKAGRNLSVGISTQRKQLNQILRLNKQIGEIEKVKGEFLDIASHQLKTPLTVVKGNVSMILDGDFGPIQKDLKKPLKEVSLGTDRLSDVINNVVDTLKFDSNIQVHLNPTLTNYRKLIESEIESFLPDTWVKNIKIDLKFQAKIPNFFVDYEKIKIAISVFLDNAVKHSENNGKISVIVSHEDGVVKTEIIDYGPKILETEAKKILSRFNSKDNENKSFQDSAGLNLYVVKRIIDSHKGKVFFTNAENDGNIFGFEIPLTLIEKRGRSRTTARLPHA